MKKLYLLCILVFIFLSMDSLGQTDENKRGRINEPTITFTSIDELGFIYKLEQKNNWYWRFLLLYGRQISSDKVGDEQYYSIDYFTPGVGLGIEKRLLIVDKLQFKTGADARFSCGQQKQIQHESAESYFNYENTYASYKLNAILGLNYLINEHFLVSAEFTPYIIYAKEKRSFESNSENTEDSGAMNYKRLSYSFTNKTVSVSLAYRFWKTNKK